MGDKGCDRGVAVRTARMEGGKNAADHEFERIDVIRVCPVRSAVLMFLGVLKKSSAACQSIFRNWRTRKTYCFEQTRFHPLLKTHKLGGALKGDWAYSINQQYRVHFYFVEDYSVVYISIGTHEIYK